MYFSEQETQACAAQGGMPEFLDWPASHYKYSQNTLFPKEAYCIINPKNLQTSYPFLKVSPCTSQ